MDGTARTDLLSEIYEILFPFNGSRSALTNKCATAARKESYSRDPLTNLAAFAVVKNVPRNSAKKSAIAVSVTKRMKFRKRYSTSDYSTMVMYVRD